MPFYPWKSMSDFATHLLFSSSCLHFSQAQKWAVLAWAKKLGATNVPSLYGLQKTSANILKLLANPTEQFTVSSGNTFYLNAISKAVAMDFANPLTHLTMQDYSEDGQGHMSQVHHGQKMLEELPDGLAPPSVCVNHDIYFVNELLQQSSKQYFIPKRQVLALGHKVSWIEVGFAIDLEQIITLVSTFSQTFENISSHSTEVAVGFTGGRMVLTVPLKIFMDNVSGNHHVVYMSNASMPHEMLEKEFCVQFVCSSCHAAPLELMQGVIKSIQ
ncbi:hypothetical protein V8B97DRAFT_2025781 [Scleroderma yunnanense]